MNSCTFNGDINSFNELNGYIDLFIERGLLDKNTESVTKLTLLVHPDNKEKQLPGIDSDCIVRSVNGYITYLKDKGDSDKSINHFFELKNSVSNSSTIGIDGLSEIIDPDIFSNPFKTASYIKFIAVNEINNMFNIDYYSRNLENDLEKINFKDKFLTCDEFLKKYAGDYSDEYEAINEYYCYLCKCYTVYFDYYALYDYLLCYAYHLEEYGKTLIENKKTGGKNKKTKNKKTKNKKTKNKKSKKNKRVKKFTKRQTFGGVKTFVEQESLLAFTKRSPVWGTIGIGTFTAAGVTLSGVGCSFAAPFIYDAFLQGTVFPGISISTIATYGLLTGSATAISLLAAAQFSSDTISIPYAESGIFEKKENKQPPDLKKIPQRKQSTPEELVEDILQHDPGIAGRINELETDLAKFNLHVIDDRFISDAALTKFRVIFRQYIVDRLKEVFENNVEEMVQLYRRKLIARKIITLSESGNTNNEITLETITSRLQEKKSNLLFTEEELISINTSARSKIAGLIISQAENKLVAELRKGKQGTAEYENISKVDKLKTPGQNYSPSILKQTENDAQTSIFTLVTSLVHIESANNYIFTPKLIETFTNVNYIYLVAWSIFSLLAQEGPKTYKEYIYIFALIIAFFYILTNILQSIGFDPINSETIINDNEKRKEIKQKEKEIYDQLNAKSPSSSPSPSPSTSPSPSSSPSSSPSTSPSPSSTANASTTANEANEIKRANQFVKDYKQFMIDYSKAEQDYKQKYGNCKPSMANALCVDSLPSWAALWAKYSIKQFYLFRNSRIVMDITRSDFGVECKKRFLQTLAFGNYVASNWKTVGGLIGILYSGRSISNTYGKFSSQIKSLVEETDRELDPYKFKFRNALEDIQNDIDNGGGAGVKEALLQQERIISGMARSNQDVQRAVELLLQESQLDLLILQEIREQTRLGNETQQLEMQRQGLAIDQRRLALEEGNAVLQENAARTAEEFRQEDAAKQDDLNLIMLRDMDRHALVDLGLQAPPRDRIEVPINNDNDLERRFLELAEGTNIANFRPNNIYNIVNNDDELEERRIALMSG